MSQETLRDPRDRLVGEKYFSLRPQPLERWLWAQRIPPAAERVFWLHWQAGLQRGDWCSELPISRVARECRVDLSTVTKAYQRLARIGCLRRTDPGRDPANPFQQATALTEVRIPRELLMNLDRYPNRRTQLAEKPVKSVRQADDAAQYDSTSPLSRPEDPFEGLSGRDRIKALGKLTQAMSAAEQSRYGHAQRHRTAQMTFDATSKLSTVEQGRVLQLLMILAADPVQNAPLPGIVSAPMKTRKLSPFEVARLRRDIQHTTFSAAAPDLLRQVTWSIEEGPLRRFATLHALNIALKKIREGAWSRPNRMPPNWALPLDAPAHRETCRLA